MINLYFGSTNIVSAEHFKLYYEYYVHHCILTHFFIFLVISKQNYINIILIDTKQLHLYTQKQ